MKGCGVDRIGVEERKRKIDEDSESMYRKERRKNKRKNFRERDKKRV